MKLKSIRIKQFRSIEDSGEFAIESLYTILAGKNESGKSSVLKAIAKLSGSANPTFAADEKPSWIIAANWTPSVAYKFELSDAEKQEIQTTFQLLLNSVSISVSNTISREVNFEGVDFSNITIPDGQDSEAFKQQRKADFSLFILAKLPQIIFHPNFNQQLAGGFVATDFSDPVKMIMLNRLEKYLLTPPLTFNAIFSNPNPDERRQILHGVSQSLDGEFVETFKQNKNKLGLDIDGTKISICITDIDEITSYESSPLTIDKRSEGFQWYFNFFITLKAENATNGSILLLDEPGIHLHPKAQEEMLEFIKKQSQGYQIIFSSHSPYLIDINKIESIRIVEKITIPSSRPVKKATIVNEKIHKGTDTDALKPIIDAIGYSVPDINLDINKPLIICEGISDYYYVKALCKHKGINTDNFGITFASNADKTAILYTLYLGLGVKDIYIVLDADADGKKAYKELATKCGVAADRVIFVTGATVNERFEFAQTAAKGTIEDIFNQAYFLSSLRNSPHIQADRLNAINTSGKTNSEILKEYEGRHTTIKYALSKYIFEQITTGTQNAFASVADSLAAKLREIGSRS